MNETHLTQYNPVLRPRHYDLGNGLEVIDVIEDLFGIDGHLPQALAYVMRAGKKDAAAQDYAKALWYVRRAKGRPDLWVRPVARYPVLAIDRALVARPDDAWPRGVIGALVRAALARHRDIWLEHLAIAETELLRAVAMRTERHG